MADFDLTQSGQEIQNILDGAAMQTDLTAENERAEQAEQQLQGNIDAEELRAKAAEEANADDIDVIESKIPAAASSENKLADKAFVSSSIATATATYRGAYNLVSDLHLTTDATEQQIAAALAGAISTADNNDYCFVQIPTADATPTQIAAIERYKFNGTSWAYEYTLNNSGFTADQWAALNSGITTGLVAKLAALPTNDELTLLLGGKQNVLTFDNVPTEGSNNPVKSGGVKSAIDSEKERAQGAEQANAGNIAQVVAMIPAAASSENQLADKNFVNSSIATNTATYRGAYNEVSDLSLTVDATHEQIAAALTGAISTADNNDYCFVQVPTADATPTQIAAIERYKFNGEAWAYEYTLNNSGFTADQWAAINSGITSGLVAKLAALPTNDDLIAALAGKQPMLTFDNVPTESSTNPVKSGGVYAAIAEEAGTRAAAIAAIVALIPSAASALNQLADKAFVNSSISTATAVFKGTFNVVADLELNYNASQAQIALMLGSKIASADNNDYCFVQIPTSNETPLEIARTDRYKYNGTAWAYEYTLNNSGFTAAQWAAINSGITSLLKDKLIDLPTATELANQLAAKQNTLTFDPTPTEGSTNPVTSDGIHAAIDTEKARALAAEQGLQDDYDELYALYQTLEGGSIIPVAAADWPVSNPQQNVIYRVANSATPTAYSDYMYNGTATLLLATFTFPGIDSEPTPDSTNLVTSGGTFDAIMQNGPAFDLSAYNAVGGTLATYADLSAALTALNALPAAYKKGGMSMKFVLSSDNKYVQYRFMLSGSFTDAQFTNVDNWQGVDDEPTAGSKSLVESGGILTNIIKAAGNKLTVYRGQIDGNNGHIDTTVIWGAYTDMQYSEQEIFVNVSSLGSLNYRIEGIAYYTDITGSVFDSWDMVRKDSFKIAPNKYYRVFIDQEPLATTDVEVQNVLLVQTGAFNVNKEINSLSFSLLGDDISKSAEWTNGNNHFYIHNYVNWKQGTTIKVEAKVDTSKLNPNKYWDLVALGTDGAQIVLGSGLTYNEVLTYTLTKDVKDIYLQINKAAWKENVTIEFDLSAQGEIDQIEDEVHVNEGITLYQGQINGNTGVITPNVNWSLYSDKINKNGAISVKSLGSNEIIIFGVAFYNKEDDSFVSFDAIYSQSTNTTYILNSLDNSKYARVMLVEPSITAGSIVPSEAILNNKVTISEEFKNLDSRVSALENDANSVDICLSDIYAVVGDTIQIFFNSIIDGYNEDMILKVVCTYGRAYNNYWECTPTTAGTTTFTISVLDKDGNAIATKTVNLIIKAATNASKNILCVGDSLMMDGEAPVELSRRLKGTTGVATSPAALNLTNFNVVGRKTNQGDTVGWEGTGGWTWYNYINGTGNPGARFYVTDADNIHIGDIYGISGFTQRFQVVEKNVTSGSGNVLLGFYGRGDIYNDHSLLPSTGTLYLVSGYGQNSITFNNSVIESFQPFWNENTDSFDIESYVDEYCGGRVDYLFVLLGINTLIGTNPYNSAAINGIANQAKQFIDLVHAQLPNTIILLGTTLMISQLGGVGTGYFTSSIDGQYNIKAFNHKTIELNKAYMELAQRDDYKDFVKIVDCSAQFDAFYGYPLMEKPYNIRVPERKELVSANTVHPMGMIGGQKWEEGIWMVADAIFRAVIGLSA